MYVAIAYSNMIFLNQMNFLRVEKKFVKRNEKALKELRSGSVFTELLLFCNMCVKLYVLVCVVCVLY